MHVRIRQRLKAMCSLATDGARQSTAQRPFKLSV